MLLASTADASSRVVIADVNVLAMADRSAPGASWSGGVRGLDADGRETSKVATVVIEDGVVREIAPPGTALWRLGDTLIRGEGLFLMPGLIDLRVAPHDPANLHLAMLRGVTTAVVEDHDWSWLKPLAEHQEVGLPRLLPSSAVPESSQGTCAGPGSLAESLMELSEGGLSPEACLRRATREAADTLGLSAAGRVEEGSVADLLLLEADPRADLAALGRIRAVILRGEVVRAARLRSTAERLKRLDEARVRLLDRASQEGCWERGWLLRFNGLPQGAIHSRERWSPEGTCRHERRTLWEPLDSELRSVTTMRDGEGSFESASWQLETPAVSLSVGAETQREKWTLRLSMAGDERSSATELILDSPSSVPLLVFDPIPSIGDLAKLASLDRPSTVSVAVTWGGNVALSPNVVVSSVWTPSDGTVAVEAAARARCRLGAAVAANPWGGERIVTLLIVPTSEPSDDASLFLPRADGSTPLRRALREPQFMLGAVAFSSEGLPLSGRFAVPDGFWEFHPLEEPPLRDQLNLRPPGELASPDGAKDTKSGTEP